MSLTPLQRPLTKLSFRRDVKLFLTLVVGFFVVLLSVLLLLLQQVLSESRDVTWRYWNHVADAAAVQAGTATNPDGIVSAIRGRQGVVGAELELRRGGRARFGPSAGGEGLEAIGRSGDWGRLTIAFDATPLAGLRRTIMLTSAIVLTGALAAFVLVLLYIPRITGPIEQMLDHAGELERRDPEVGEQEFLIETFRKSVATMKAQQEELRVLHDAQKSRADDFERVTAALMRGLTSGLLAIGPDGRVVEVNEAAREMLRIAAPSDVVGRDLRDAIGDGEFARMLRDALGRRAPLTRIETTHRTGDGASLVIGVTTVPLMNEAGALLGMLALFTDLTSIRSLEDRVRDLQALADLGEMSAGIAHEFRNSLSAILGYLKLAQRQGTPEEVTNKLRRAEEEASQLSAAVASLLSFARPMAMTPEEIRLRELVDSVIDRLEPSANGTAFHVSGDAVVNGDRALLSRAVENVLRNALESTQEKGGTGRVEVAIDEARRRITVRDNGVGLDPQSAARMFLPFQSEKANGFGLGLALTKKIVLLHGGAIRLTGVPGEGAVVEMELG
ncbi:MAG TPA: ATP-binding protein [Thermoanaerobaculia bacterium]|nr:ATP-binding protein [Thermoanaerobaculia bacterium]